eukprot:10071190-Alexandrium_andersonii.AAC.1
MQAAVAREAAQYAVRIPTASAACEPRCQFSRPALEASVISIICSASALNSTQEQAVLRKRVSQTVGGITPSLHAD